MQAPATILLYTAPSRAIGTRLQQSIQSICIGNNIIVARNQNELSTILRRPFNGVAAVVIYRATQKGLAEILQLREELLRLPTILVLPNQDQEIIADSHTLRPRLLSYRDSDFNDVRSVLQRILQKRHTIH